MYQSAIPVCQSEGYGTADLLDIATGLRAMVKNSLPQSKPAAPVVISEVLPQSGPREHVARRAAQIKGSRFVSLARCEEQAWAELSYAASNTQVWAGGRILKGITPESSMEAIASSYEDPSAPEELGLFGTTDGTVLDQLASDEEAAWKVGAIKAALSDREWTAIQMKADGLPDAAIAEAIGATMPTAWKVIRQARAKAKAALV
jgi:DNA-binding NarL/FixJ family response regulator